MSAIMHKNIYERSGKYYIDCHIDGVRIRKSTGLKISKESLAYVRENYENFLSFEEGQKAKQEFLDFEDEKFFKEELLGIKPEKIIKKNREKSFEYLIECFLREKKFLRKNTLKNYHNALKILIDFLKKTKIIYVYDFKREHSPLFLDFCYEKKLQASSIKQYKAIINGLFLYAIDLDLIVKSPFKISKIKEINENKRIKDPFSLDEMKRLLQHAQGDLRLYLLLGFFTGARTGEILALQYKDLDFINKEIRISKTKNEITCELGETKTKSSNRIIDMIRPLELELKKLCKDKSPDEFLILQKSSILRSKFTRLLKSLDIKPRRLYDTRHTFASIMLSKGEEPMWVGVRMLGHCNLNMTYQVYAKYLPKAVKERAVFLNDFLDKD